MAYKGIPLVRSTLIEKTVDFTSGMHCSEIQPLKRETLKYGLDLDLVALPGHLVEVPHEAVNHLRHWLHHPLQLSRGECGTHVLPQVLPHDPLAGVERRYLLF